MSARPLTLALSVTTISCGSNETAPAGAITLEVREAVITHRAAPDTLLGAVRDLVLTPMGVRVAAAGRTPLAFYDMALTTATYPDLGVRGPFPLRDALSLEGEEDGAVLVWEGTSGRILRLRSEGLPEAVAEGPAWVQRIQAPGWDFLGGRRDQPLRMDTGLFAGRIGRSAAGSGDLDHTAFVAVDGEGRDTVLRFRTERTELDSVMEGARLFGPFPLVARCARDRVAVYRPAAGSVVFHDAAWRATDSLVLPGRPRPRSIEMGRELFAQRLLRSSAGE